MRKPRIDWKGLGNEVERRILDTAVEALPGEDKMDRVLDHVVDWLDEQIRFKGPVGTFAEAVSDFVIRQILRPIIEGLVQDAFDRLRSEGRV